jgi:hypothetical protein
VASDLLNINPKLGPLQDNGGPTQTIALLPGSPAIDAGDLTDSEWDQRGPGYPRLVNGATDIGAYEVQNGQGTGSPARAHRFPEATLMVLRTATSQASAPTPAAGGPITPTVPSRPVVAAVDRFFASRCQETGVFLSRSRQHIAATAGWWALDFFPADGGVVLLHGVH